MNPPLKQPPKEVFWAAVSKHLIPALQKQEKPIKKTEK